MLSLDVLKQAQYIQYSTEWSIEVSFPAKKRKAKREESGESIRSHLKELRS